MRIIAPPNVPHTALVLQTIPIFYTAVFRSGQNKKVLVALEEEHKEKREYVFNENLLYLLILLILHACQLISAI